MPYDPDHDVAFNMAKKRIATYKGSKPVLPPQTAMVVQQIVLDALPEAPQPVGDGWVHTSLMAVGGLVRWAQTNGEPITPSHLLSLRTRERFLNLGCKGLKDGSVRNYRSRLDLIATALLPGVPAQPATTKALPPADAVKPHTSAEVAGLWIWVRSIRNLKTRQRAVATLILGLGFGLRSTELVSVRASDISRDPHGVHLVAHGKDGDRVITCRVTWENHLLTLLQDLHAATRPNVFLVTPWRGQPASRRTQQHITSVAQRTDAGPPPALFSSQSLRNTWIVDHLTKGTPIPTLLDAAGIKSIEALKAYLPYVPTATAQQRATDLR